MLDPAITNFLAERKADRLKKKIKSTTSDDDKEEFERQAEEEFSLAVWLPKAAKRAKQLSLVSHPSKFSHPGAKTTNIIAKSLSAADGFLRTGNVSVGLDVFGNAAAMDVYKFLVLKMADGETILTHLEKKTAFIAQQFNVPTMPFAEIEQGLLAIREDSGEKAKTSSRVKQVYFPVEHGEYHLLSVLTPSNVMYALKERIQELHFSEEAKTARKAKKESKAHEKALSEVYGLSVIGYGGTKPQNISVLNSQHGGAAYLLPSMPPDLSSRRVQPPRLDFFSNSLWFKLFQDDFQKFHAQLIADTNNVHVRRKRDFHIRAIVYQVVDRLWQIRSLEPGWSSSVNYRKLPRHQKIWLDQEYEDIRGNDLAWFETIHKELARWFVGTYKKILGNNALSLGDDQLPHIRKIITECEGGLL